MGPLDAEPVEDQVKASMLYHLTRFVEWPEGSFRNASDPILVGFLGETPIRQSLADVLTRNPPSGRPLALHHLTEATAHTRVHILFVAASLHGDAARLLANVPPGVLTVSDMSGFLAKGGAIGFFTVAGHVRFEINSDAAILKGIAISSKLLRLAANWKK